MAQLENKELQRFQNLRDRVIEVVNQLLQKNRMPTRTMSENLIRVSIERLKERLIFGLFRLQMELAFINTNHPDFVGGDGAISSILEKMVNQKQEQQPNTNGTPTNTNPFVCLLFLVPLSDAYVNIRWAHQRQLQHSKSTQYHRSQQQHQLQNQSKVIRVPHPQVRILLVPLYLSKGDF